MVVPARLNPDAVPKSPSHNLQRCRLCRPAWQINFELQALYHEQTPAIILSQQTRTLYEQRWVDGFYYNPLLAAGHFYAHSLQE